MTLDSSIQLLYINNLLSSDFDELEIGQAIKLEAYYKGSAPPVLIPPEPQTEEDEEIQETSLIYILKGDNVKVDTLVTGVLIVMLNNIYLPFVRTLVNNAAPLIILDCNPFELHLSEGLIVYALSTRTMPGKSPQITTVTIDPDILMISLRNKAQWLALNPSLSEDYFMSQDELDWYMSTYG